jgi:hypothetical protein
MASRPPWTEGDKAFLETLADRRDWIAIALKRFPHRTEAAIRCMMQKVRGELGLCDGRFFENAWMADAAMGSARLLAALHETGQRP